MLPKYKKELAEYEKNLREYELELKNAQKNYNEDMQQILTKAKDRRGDLTADIQSTKAQLQKAYSLNIIPLQFRNIQGIYYLYDYISTSNQGLSEALMQCNLDAACDRAMKQIADKNYAEDLKQQYYKKVLKYGVAFCSEKVCRVKLEEE